jgi:CMP/dCMP kinase
MDIPGTASPLAPPFQIAIDGPVAAGKGTVSRLVAERLQFLYVDTGAMYRVTALVALEKNVPLTDESALVNLVQNTQIVMRNPSEDERDGRLTTVLVNNIDVSWKIRTEEIGAGSSTTAAHKGVREVLVQKQQEIAQSQNVVMEGRDITYRVLPEAQLKIYLTANDVVRAKRRHLQLQTKGEDISFEEVFSQLTKRDYQDTHRVTDPLQVVEGAWVIDSSDLSIEQVVDLITSKARIMMESREP